MTKAKQNKPDAKPENVEQTSPDTQREAPDKPGAGQTGDAQTSASPAKPVQAEPVPVVVVVGPKRGRRRIGRQFGPEPQSIPLEELSEVDKAALLADPALIVTLPLASDPQ